MALATLIVPPPAPGRTRKGDKLLSQGRTHELRKEYDKALELYEQALSEDPSDAAYTLSTNRVRFQAATSHVDRGQKLRNQGNLEEALAAFERGYAIDPALAIAEQEIRRTRAIIERSKKSELKPEERNLTPVDLAKRDALARSERMQAMPELKPLSAAPINLKMNNQVPRVLFETVGKLAGINVLFDPDFVQQATRPLSVEFNGSTLEEALDHLSVMNKGFWKALSPNTIFVTRDDATKRREYEEQVMKVFYLTNVNTPQELQEVATIVRTICDIRRLFTYNAQMAIIIRAEADRVALAEKLLQDLDKPKAEVVIDVLVLEANRSRSRDLAISASPSGISTPIIYGGQKTSTTTPADTSATTPTPTDDSASGARSVKIGQYSLTLPIGKLEAVMSDRNTRVLQSPQVRAADNFKASLRIGDKVPTASGSFQPGIGGVGINPLVNTQFQYIEVGVNVDITPKIHGADEVSLHVEVDISNVRDRVDLG
ncbi:MAG: hypothetical protein ACRD96_10385, partial [Bryobacteraceae bacterium]